MKLMWLGYFFEIGILTLIKPYVVDFRSLGVLAVLIHVLFSMVMLFSLNKKIRFIILFAFFIRVLFLFWDLYGGEIFVFPNSGLDSEMYYRNAVLISDNFSLLGETRGGPYSDIHGLLFHFIGPQRILGQYMNVLLGVSTVVLVYKILIMLKTNEVTVKVITILFSFFPNSMIMSAIFIREAFPTYFVALSLYYFVKWFKNTETKYIFISFVTLGLASIFHSGVIGIALGYVFSFLFYNKEKNKLKFSGKTVFAFIVTIALMYISFTIFDDLFFRKFQNVEGIEDIYLAAVPAGLGGSAYLKGIEINNFNQFILFSPLKSIYFLFSPIPLDWRGMMDVFTFFTDSIFYLGTFLYFIKNRKKLNEKKILVTMIIIMIAGSSFIFGVGVSNAGTAMRHRQKLISLFFILLALIIDRNGELNNKITDYPHNNIKKI